MSPSRGTPSVPTSDHAPRFSGDRPGRLRPALLTVLGAFLGAALAGLAEAGRVSLSATFDKDRLGIGLVLALGSLIPALVLSPPAILLGLPLARQTAGRRLRWGFVYALGAFFLWDLGIWWFTDPPPFQDPLPFQGNPTAYGVVAFASCLLLCLLAWRVRGRRPVAVATLIIVLLLGLFTGSGLSLGVKSGILAPGAPNVLWVTLDTARADHFGAYGSEVSTPSFDRLASQGVLFENAFAQIAVTGPSHTTMLTGAGPWRHGSLNNGIPIPRDATTITEFLREKGYRTGAFVSAYVLDGELGFARGFDIYDDDFGLVQGASDLLPFRSLAMLRRHFDPDEVVERRGGPTVDHALKWLSHQDGPFFLWVHLFDPHGPYEPPEPFASAFYQGDPRDPSKTSMPPAAELPSYMRGSLKGITDLDWVRAQYSGEIAYADMQIGRLLGWLDSRGLTEKTVIVVAGDHGESLGEHGYWFNHGENLYDPSTRVPFVIRVPGEPEPGARVQELAELGDLAPTLLGVLGYTPPPAMEGRSLLKGAGRIHARGLCFDREANMAARAAGTIDKPVYRMVSLRGATSLYVHHEAEGQGDEYYDLLFNPSQTASSLALYALDPQGGQILPLLRDESQQILDGMGADTTQRSNATLSGEQESKLKALGYME